jgi:hypothetical protein
VNGQDPNVRLQNLRDFTVQIRHTKTGAIVGTGVVVSMDGKIVTCAHVVRKAGVDPRRGVRILGYWELVIRSIFRRKSKVEVDSGNVSVYFPQARGGERKDRCARVEACFSEPYDDDVALLQLVDGPAPLGPEQIPHLGRADESDNHPFCSYGYRLLEDFVAGLAYGRILGSVEPPPGRNIQADPVQLESQQINRGMSGAAVLDIDLNLVVGIVSEMWFPDLSTRDRDTAWAVNAHVLSLEPLGLALRDAPLPKQPAPQPKTNIAEARAAVSIREKIVLHAAPPPLDKWVGRVEKLKAISEDWTASDRRVTGLIGIGGEGKSSLARRWLTEMLHDNALPRPDDVFW